MAMFQGGYSNFAAKRAARHGRRTPGTSTPTQTVPPTENKQVENTNTKKRLSNPNRMLKGHPPQMAYPSAKGLQEITGDSFLIKCFKYVPPKTDISLEYETRQTDKAGVYNGLQHNVGDIAMNAPNDNGIRTAKQFPVKGSARLQNFGGSDAIKFGRDAEGRKHQPLYYVELPIPQDVNDSNTVTWSDDSMNIFQLAGLSAVNSFLKNPGQSFEEALDLVRAGIPDSMFSGNLKNQLTAIISGKAIDALGNNINTNSVLGRAEGTILNSNLELLFNGVNLRTFPFSINFSPRNAEESKMVKYIIRAFKSSMAAKKGTEEVGQGGAFLRAPDVFHLEYRHQNRTHPFLNSFKHCALTGMTVNYTQAGTYASYYDGTPVNLRMNLTFKELNPIYHEDYDFDENMRGVGF